MRKAGMVTTPDDKSALLPFCPSALQSAGPLTIDIRPQVSARAVLRTPHHPLRVCGQCAASPRGLRAMRSHSQGLPWAALGLLLEGQGLRAARKHRLPSPAQALSMVCPSTPPTGVLHNR